MSRMRVFWLIFFYIMQNTKRNMTVVSSPGDNRQKPMIRIRNNWLSKAGFPVGSRIQVKYKDSRIVITRMPFQIDSGDDSNNCLAVQR